MKLFYCLHSKKVAFLMFRSASKQVSFALGVDPTARDAGEDGFRPSLASYALHSVVWTSSRPCSLATQV